MENIKLSVCIPVYNQNELLEKCLKKILQYPNNDIEIIVNDNCSTQDVQGLIFELNDERIKYYCNEQNIGQDLNILSALSKCRSKFAFLLRTRDMLDGEKIPIILKYLKEFPDGAYFQFSCVDEFNNIRLQFSENVSCNTNTNIKWHKKLFIHPSGMCFNISYLDLKDIENYIGKYFKNHYGFMAHQLIRQSLVEKGEFIISKESVWIYVHTNKAIDVSANAMRDKKNPYCAELQYPRMDCEIDFALHSMKEKSAGLIKSIIERYFYQIIYAFKEVNEDQGMLQHYNCEKMEFDERKERKNFKVHLENIETEIPKYQERIAMLKVDIKERIFRPLYKHVRKIPFVRNIYYNIKGIAQGNSD